MYTNPLHAIITNTFHSDNQLLMCFIIPGNTLPIMESNSLSGQPITSGKEEENERNIIEKEGKRDNIRTKKEKEEKRKRKRNPNSSGKRKEKN